MNCHRHRDLLPSFITSESLEIRNLGPVWLRFLFTGRNQGVDWAEVSLQAWGSRPGPCSCWQNLCDCGLCPLACRQPGTMLHSWSPLSGPCHGAPSTGNCLLSSRPTEVSAAVSRYLRAPLIRSGPPKTISLWINSEMYDEGPQLHLQNPLRGVIQYNQRRATPPYLPVACTRWEKLYRKCTSGWGSWRPS